MLKKLLLLSLLVLGFPTVSQAVLLSGGPADFPINGTTSLDKPSLAGVIIEDLLTPFSISGVGETLSGQIQNRVVRSDVDGTLDFYWRILPDAGSGDISAFRVGGFEGFTLDADWRPDGVGDVAPTIARYFGDGTGNVNFLFDPDEVGGNGATSPYTESYFFYLDTDAVAYNMSGEFDLLCAPNDCISELYSTFAPAVVPVPAAVWLFGTALVGFIGFSRRRKV